MLLSRACIRGTDFRVIATSSNVMHMLMSELVRVHLADRCSRVYLHKPVLASRASEKAVKRALMRRMTSARASLDVRAVDSLDGSADGFFAAALDSHQSHAHSFDAWALC